MRCAGNISLVTTIKERCRICYTCVRECPAKAIRIADGQAEVLPERCVGCGNCVRVCSQAAKEVLDSIKSVKALLEGPGKVAAIIAPSFPAQFKTTPWRHLVGMIRALGFDHVNEVAFGADIVADRYKRLLASGGDDRYIATTCPAVIAFIEQYHPTLVDNLAPIVSPMIAMARILKHSHGDDLKMVFIGPCIAKKGEAASENLCGEVDASLTFTELQTLFDEKGVSADAVQPSDFDPPQAGTGALFPVSRGLLQAADIKEDIIEGDVVAADGRSKFVEAIREFEARHLDVKLLEILACNGCVMGPGISSKMPLFSRRASISQYVREKMQAFDGKAWRQAMAAFEDLDFSRPYRHYDQRIPIPEGENIDKILAKMGKTRPEDELNCGACGYDTCRDHAVAILKGLAESEMCLPFAIEKLHTTVMELATSNRELATTQEALMNSERLASMGQLAAGIAHEVNNPLGVVLMYSHLLLDEHKGDEKLGEDLKLIAEQADRCKKIVSGLLNFARQNKLLKESHDICGIIDNTMKTLPPPDGVKVHIRRAIDDPVIELDKDQFIQVLTNLVTNAYAAMENGGGDLTISVKGADSAVTINVQDTGTGIPEDNISKIFDPFFTTKQIGKGTGLGLAVTYGIVKMHSGNISVASNDKAAKGPTGTTFKVTLPRNVSINPPERNGKENERPKE